MDDIRNGRLFSAAIAILVAGGVVAGGAARAASLTVPESKSIPVTLTQTITSQTAHVGDPFTFTTAQAVTLGTLLLPKGTPGHGRLAVVFPADANHAGQLGLQADSLDLPGGDVVWVNIDATKPPKGHLADKHSKPVFIPTPIGFGGGYRTTSSGNMILDSGTSFTVVTIAPRAAPAPLLTASPTPVPTLTPMPRGMHATPAPVASPSLPPVPVASATS
jgi:hypothetical protein